MTKRTEKTGGRQGANTEATALARLLAPLVDGMTTTRHELLTWVQGDGLVGRGTAGGVGRRRRVLSVVASRQPRAPSSRRSWDAAWTSWTWWRSSSTASTSRARR